MKTKLFRKNLFIYELKNVIGNPFNLGFGILFPIMMGILMSLTIVKGLPENSQEMVKVQFFIGYLVVSPLAIIFLGFASLFSQELENETVLRLNLFGYNNPSILCAKLLSNLVCSFVGVVLYALIVGSVVQISLPSLKTIILMFVFVFGISILLFVLSYCIAMLFKKFGPTFAIVMSLYFFIMIISGLFGVRLSSLPKVFGVISDNFPLSYITNDAYSLWIHSDSYNFAPIIQAFMVSGSLVCLLLLIVLRRNKRG